MIAAKERRPTNGTGPPPTVVRVAIYTRQSVADELEFNSLDAQRQAIEAYVQSQRSQGWEALPDRYDDHGFSGGTIERPAFQRLLKDVEAGKVHVVAVHRLDRLSRSIGDFVRLMDFFEKHGVTLVSTTQAFDTSTSLGRMTLNLLATFATYERDMIRERTQEKMSATRRRGLWTGGTPVLGYDLIEKKLIVNEGEAERVREIFRLYLQLGSLLVVSREVTARGWTTKSRTCKDGKVIEGKPFDKDAISRLLTNPVYCGQVFYRGRVYDGAHEAIVDRETWDAVQQQLRQHGASGRRGQSKNGALLGGLLRCGVCGAAMSLHSARRGHRKYLYYACTTYQRLGASACPGSRLAARDIESFVVQRIRAIGKDPGLVAETLKAAREQLHARRPEIQAELRRIEKDRGKLDLERQNLVEAIAKAKAGSPSLLQCLGEVEVKVSDIDDQADRLQRELSALEDRVIDEADLRSALASFEPVWEELFPAERARIIRLLIETVRFDAAAGEVAITFRPGGIKVLASQKDTP